MTRPIQSFVLTDSIGLWFYNPGQNYLRTFFFVNTHYLTQQNCFQIKGLAERKPPHPVQCYFLQLPRDEAQQHCFWGEVGKEESPWLQCLEKFSASMKCYQEFCPSLLLLPLSYIKLLQILCIVNRIKHFCWVLKQHIITTLTRLFLALA